MVPRRVEGWVDLGATKGANDAAEMLISQDIIVKQTRASEGMMCNLLEQSLLNAVLDTTNDWHAY